MQSMHEEGNTEKHIDICDEVLYKVLVCDATWRDAARRDMGHHYTRSRRRRGEMPLCYLKFLWRTLEYRYNFQITLLYKPVN